MFGVFDSKRQRIVEDRFGLLEADAMLFQVGGGFFFMPFK